MNRRPGFRNFGRGVGRGWSKSGFFGWVTLLTVVGLRSPMLVAVDVAPVWNVPTPSENSAGGGAGSSGTAADPAAAVFDVGVERTGEYHLVVKTPIAGTADPGPGLVQLRNVNTNLCMTVPDNRKDNDVQLIQGDYKGAKNQIFRMHSLLNSEIGNALFIIIPEHSRESSTLTKPSKRSCIRMIDTWSSNSWRIVQWECRGSLIYNSMKFSIESAGNNYYTILSLSGRCIRSTNLLSNARIVGDNCINYIIALDGQDILYWRIENANL